MSLRSTADILRLLDALQEHVADELEGQDLDFKEWIARSVRDARAQVIDMAVCMANGGGGTVVFGVADKVRGRARAIVGVPGDIDVPALTSAIYNGTDPKITAAFEELSVPEGTGRLLVMQVFGGLAPYTDTAGSGRIRQGKDCLPLTGTLRAQVMVESGTADFTAPPCAEPPAALLSPAAMEVLRKVAAAENAPADLLARPDLDLLGALGVVQDGRLSRAGVLLGGSDDALARVVPNYLWTHLRMRSDTDYSDRADGRSALALALMRLEERINADNPITTIEHGFYHFEYRAYPERALREALLNALCHTDFRIASPVLVKQYTERLDISNPGGFIGGITPANILNHAPVARNPVLVQALMRLRLVNRSNLGISRMYEATLTEGKSPPRIDEPGRMVRVSFCRQAVSAPFRAFVADEAQRGHILTVPQLIVLHHLLAHPEADTATLALNCQKSEEQMLDLLDDMARRLGHVERGGAGRGTFWTLAPDLHERLAEPGQVLRDRRLDWEAVKARVLSLLVERARRGQPGLANADLRQITRLSRRHVLRLMQELMTAHPEIQPPGRGRWGRYRYESGQPAAD